MAITHSSCPLPARFATGSARGVADGNGKGVQASVTLMAELHRLMAADINAPVQVALWHAPAGCPSRAGGASAKVLQQPCSIVAPVERIRSDDAGGFWLLLEVRPAWHAGCAQHAFSTHACTGMGGHRPHA